MKKMSLVLLASFAFAITSSAQGGGFQRRTPEERTASIHTKLDSAFKVEPVKLASLDTALTVLFKAQDARMQELRSAAERPDREAMQAEMKKYTDAQDEMLKAVLTKEQFDIWKEKIQPAMRPQRAPGGGGN